MRKFLLLLVLCVAGLLPLVGCGSMDTEDERSRRLDAITDIQARQFVDDWDYFWLYERNNRMSQWHTSAGY